MFVRGGVVCLCLASYVLLTSRHWVGREPKGTRSFPASRQDSDYSCSRKASRRKGKSYVSRH